MRWRSMQCIRSESPVLKPTISETKYSKSFLCRGSLQPNSLENSRTSTLTVSSNSSDGSRKTTICTGMTGRKNLETNQYPRSMVLISPGMRQSYLRFGDLVAFDITYGLLRNVAHDSLDWCSSRQKLLKPRGPWSTEICSHVFDDDIDKSRQRSSYCRPSHPPLTAPSEDFHFGLFRLHF